MSTNFAKEFKLYESMFSKEKAATATKPVLKESRSAEDI
jgi:hypothetical protein